jgi:hypothetical protein
MDFIERIFRISPDGGSDLFRMALLLISFLGLRSLPSRKLSRRLKIKHS